MAQKTELFVRHFSKATAVVQSRLKNREAKAGHMTEFLYEDIAVSLQASTRFKHKALVCPYEAHCYSRASP